MLQVESLVLHCRSENLGNPPRDRGGALLRGPGPCFLLGEGCPNENTRHAHVARSLLSPRPGKRQTTIRNKGAEPNSKVAQLNKHHRHRPSNESPIPVQRLHALG
jgi:hypothetical protein